jgi:hypothetical protein
MEPTISQRYAVTKKMVAAYKHAAKSDNAAILDSLVELTGWHRESVQVFRSLRNTWTDSIRLPPAT